MDITSNDIYYLISKKIKDKIIQNKKSKPNLPSISLAKRIELLRQQKKEEEQNEDYEKYFKGIILNESNITNFIYNTVNPNINKCFQNLEYLSIANNYLINLNFIINIPDLFYLDVFNNPLDDFNTLNYKNIFGYLRLSVDKFHENKILAFTGLNCAILDIEIKDKAILRTFKINNPNILMINNEINYYVDQLISNSKKVGKIRKSVSNVKSGNNNNNNINNNEHDMMNKIEDGENDSQNNSEKSENNINENFKKSNSNYNRNNNIKIEIKKEYLLEIKNFFEELNQVLYKIKKKN